MSLGVLKLLVTKNEPVEREERRMTFKNLRYVLAPTAQPFRMMGKSFPGRGRGPRLTDRKYYK